jgi:hypothetical protein
MRAAVAWRTPRSAKSWLTVRDVIELPRSAWSVNWFWATPWRKMASAISCSAKVSDSLVATSHPTT